MEFDINMLDGEIDRILKEELKDCNELERLIVKINLLQIAQNVMGTTKLKRIMFSVLEKYYAVIEGLEKK